MTALKDTARNPLQVKYITQESPIFRNSTPTSGYMYDDAIRLQNHLRELPDPKLQNCLNTLRKIKAWHNNWDGNGSAKPSKKALDNAKAVITDIYNYSKNAREVFLEPNITAGGDGEALLEWWYKDKSLSLYIYHNQITYLKAPNENISEMEDGTIKKLKMIDYHNLFSWLKSNVNK